MSERTAVKTEKWGVFPLTIDAISVLVAVLVIGYAYSLFGPPWRSFASLAGYGIGLAFPLMIILFLESMLPRAVVVSPGGAEFRYLFSSRNVEWSRLSLSRNQPRNWERLVNVEEYLPGRKVTRFHRVSPEQASAMKVWMRPAS
jgi:hypothetical protein